MKAGPYSFKKSNVPWIQGRRHTEKTKKKISESRTIEQKERASKIGLRNKGKSPWNKGIKNAK